MWDYFGAQPYAGDNFIPELSTMHHVTSIELGFLLSDNSIYTLNILGDGVTTRAPIPIGGCSQTLNIHTLTIGASERVTKVEAWRDENSFKWYRIELTM